MSDVVDIKTGKPRVKKQRRKTSQDAKRWLYLVEQVRSGEITLSISGLDIHEAGYLDATIDQFDEEIDRLEHLKKSEAEKARRKRKT